MLWAEASPALSEAVFMFTHAQLQPSMRRLLTLLIASLMLAPAACGKGTSLGGAPDKKAGEGKSGDKDDENSLSAKQILQKGGLCTEDREVTEAEEGSDEWVILRIYQLALGPDNAETFETFRAFFPQQRNTRQLKEMYWPRIRKNVHKYLIEPGEAGYVICRIMPTDRGRKYYIKTTDPRQHPPPIEIGERDGDKKVLAFTPF